MKQFQSLILILLLVIVIPSCNHPIEKPEYGKATKELITLLNSNPELKSMLETSLEKARQINPDRNSNPAQNLEEYYQFVTWSEKTMPWPY